jgi:nitrogen PTS system EIIA component
MNMISPLLSPERIRLGLHAENKAALLTAISESFPGTGIAPKDVLESLHKREKLGSTALGHGIAIPHGRIKRLKEACGCLVRLAEPIAFDSPDGQPVRLVFALLVPASASDLHLQILSELAQLFSDPGVREVLLNDPDARQLRHRIEQWKP